MKMRFVFKTTPGAGIRVNRLENISRRLRHKKHYMIKPGIFTSQEASSPAARSAYMLRAAVRASQIRHEISSPIGTAAVDRIAGVIAAGADGRHISPIFYAALIFWLLRLALLVSYVTTKCLIHHRNSGSMRPAGSCGSFLIRGPKVSFRVMPAGPPQK